MGYRGVVLAAVAAGALMVSSGCGETSRSKAAGTTTTAPPTTVAAPTGSTTWLCHPGLTSDPCRSDRTSQLHQADPTDPTDDPGVDCFYVYPTVSSQQTMNANLDRDPELEAVARQQVSRFSSVCRVYAPIYRQLTLASIVGAASGDFQAASRTAFGDVQRAWEEYLAATPPGRPVVLIGHSQGAVMLTELLARVISPKPDQVKRTRMAILIGGNATGSDAKGYPACTPQRRTQCIVAFSMFPGTAPADAAFGRAGVGPRSLVDLGDDNAPVICTNPVTLDAGVTQLHSFFETTKFPGLIGDQARASFDPKLDLPTDVPWLELEGLYEGECRTDGAVRYFSVRPVGNAPKLLPMPSASWGVHLLEMNLAMGNLVDLVSALGQSS